MPSHRAYLPKQPAGDFKLNFTLDHQAFKPEPPMSDIKKSKRSSVIVGDRYVHYCYSVVSGAGTSPIIW